MENPDYHFVHTSFKLNGFHLDKEKLLHIAYSYIKEGELYQKAVGDFLLYWFDSNNYIEMQTSGTTGAPKIIKVNKQAMVNSALATGKFFDLIAGSKALYCLPTQYVAGKMMLVRALILGWDIDLVEPNSTPLKRNETIYDFSAMVPLQAMNSLEQLGQIKKLIIGGAKVNRVLAEKLVDIPTDIYETYGMTETITHIAAKKVGEEIFTVLPNVIIKEDSRHCLTISAPAVAEDVIMTNDVVKVLNDKQFIWLGRYDNVINSGGIKLFPEQIEEKLAPHIKERFFIKGVPDEKLGEKIILVIEGKRFEINGEIFSGLNKYEVPKRVLFAKRFAETASGKVIRNKTIAE